MFNYDTKYRPYGGSIVRGKIKYYLTNYCFFGSIVALVAQKEDPGGEKT